MNFTPKSVVLLLSSLLIAACPVVEEGSGAGDCSDDEDNDGDRLVDCSDPGCRDTPECTEEEPWDDDDAVGDDDETDDDDSAPSPVNVYVRVIDGPNLDGTTPQGAGALVYTFNPMLVDADGLPMGDPTDQTGGDWKGGFEGGLSLSLGKATTLVAFVDADGDREICTEGDHHGWAEVTRDRKAVSVLIELDRVLDGTECERDGKPEK